MRSLIVCHALVAALGDDVGGAEVEGQLLPGLVPAHRDDPLGAELARGEDAQQADRAVADHGDGLARAGLGGDGAEPAGAEHVGGGQQARDQVVGRHAGRGDEGAVGQRDPGALGLGADGAHEFGVHAAGLVAGPADRAGVVGGEERADHELAGPQGADLAADLLDDADVLVAHRRWPVDGLDAAVGPQVGPAHAGRGHRMTASVGFSIVGSGRSSTRTSPGAWRTAPRMTGGSSRWGSWRFSRRGRPAWRRTSRSSPSAIPRRTRGG